MTELKAKSEKLSQLASDDFDDDVADCESGAWKRPPAKAGKPATKAAPVSASCAKPCATTGGSVNCDNGLEPLLHSDHLSAITVQDSAQSPVAETDGAKSDSANASSQPKSEEEMKNNKRALWMSMITLLISIPALVGAWCWPALLISLVGGTVTASARSAGHSVSYVITSVMMLVLVAYTASGSQRRSGTKFQKYGPLVFVMLSVPLVMADPTRHLLQDANIWPAPGSSEYRAGCPTETIRCLTVLGVFFTIVMTYSGFAMLIIGTLWNANFMDKLREIRDKWRELRSAHRAAKQSQV